MRTFACMCYFALLCVCVCVRVPGVLLMPHCATIKPITPGDGDGDGAGGRDGGGDGGGVVLKLV